VSGLAGDLLALALVCLVAASLERLASALAMRWFTALPVALFALWASSDDMALAVVLDFDEAARVADVSRMTIWRGVPWVLAATARMIWGRS
jgi:hypothetical protein